MDKIIAIDCGKQVTKVCVTKVGENPDDIQMFSFPTRMGEVMALYDQNPKVEGDINQYGNALGFLIKFRKALGL